MTFYTFNQNNSGGHFDVDENVCHRVIIEALNVEHAIARAENIGIYFDGVEKGIDCPCCGDRWCEPWDNEGTDTPMIYGEPASEYYKSSWTIPSVIIHYADGRKESF